MDSNISQKSDKKDIIRQLSNTDSSLAKLVFSYKKASKLMSVIYLITDGFIGQDNLKETLRDTSLKIVRDILSLISGVNQRVFSNELQANFLLSVSLLETSLVVKVIDQPIASILVSEYQDLLSVVQTIESSVPSYKNSPYVVQGVQKELSSLEEITLNNFKNRTETNSSSHLTNTINNVDKTYKRTIENNPIQKSQKETQKGYVTEKDKEREVKVIERISNENNKGQGMSIKDISILFPNVSEKTVQRLLLSMVERGILRKEGERRWSRYFIGQ